MKAEAPIGIFDSGVGGTSIWKEIHQLLPYEHTLYLADSQYAPYGNRPKEEIISLSKKNTEYLLEKGSKIIVVACNTATTNAISQLRSEYEVPFIGIEPAIKPAALKTKTKSIGILATKGTLSSELFHKTAESVTYGIKLTEVVGEGLVPLIEKGNLDTPELHALLQRYLKPMLEARIDHLVLGCSHYPYLVPLLRDMLPEDVKIIDSGEAVARQTQAVLRQHDLLNPKKEDPKLQFYTNAQENTLHLLLKDHAEKVQIEKKKF
ncbi:glutamate racemase [Aureisphaera galaxeae]|uniref:glutamate racemase n=1 Tax=Aureisphaera galaxeae TaxID=1538023 RepID=UPI003AF32D81